MFGVSRLIFNPDFLKRCRAVTEYYEEKYGIWTPKDQVLKMYEEVGEVHRSKEVKETLEETCDVILASITMFDIMGLPYDRFEEIMEKTLQKVESRITKNDKGDA